MARGTAAEIAQLIEKTPLFRAGDSRQFGSKDRSNTTCLGTSGDFGQSIINKEPALPLVVSRFMVSAEIVVVAVILASLIAVPAGVIAAWGQNSATDLILIGTATVLLSMPTFWLGLLLLLFFGLKLGWLPVLGYVSLADNFVSGLLYLVLPIMTLVIHEAGVLIRMSRASTLEVLRRSIQTF